MKTQINVFPLKHEIVMNAAGTLDLAASKTALNLLVANPGFETSREVLLDLRGVECEMTTADIFEIAACMALPASSPPTTRQIAVLVDTHQHGHLPFNAAQFLELCADNRGLNLRVFENHETANAWLNPELPNDQNFLGTLPRQRPPFPGYPPEIIAS